MLSSSERRNLDHIELMAIATDGRFANGLRDGVPRIPREYLLRRVSWGLLALAVVLASTGGLLIATGRFTGILLAWSAVLLACWALRGRRRLRPGH
ncbi:MAG: DUF3040 domain-containing protein [Actinocatenispora sp.]